MLEGLENVKEYLFYLISKKVQFNFYDLRNIIFRITWYLLFESFNEYTARRGYSFKRIIKFYLKIIYLVIK